MSLLAMLSESSHPIDVFRIARARVPTYAYATTAARHTSQKFLDVARYLRTCTYTRTRSGGTRNCREGVGAGGRAERLISGSRSGEQVLLPSMVWVWVNERKG